MRIFNTSKSQFNIYIKSFIIILFCYYIIIYKNKLPSKNEKKNIHEKVEYSYFKNKVYKLTNKKYLANNSFRALYISNYENESVQLMNKIYENYIESIIVDNEVKNKSSFYLFFEPGFHEIIVSLNMEKLNSSENMFSDLSNLILIDFSQNFESVKLESMKGMFMNCINLEAVNFDEKINLINVNDLSYMFQNCISLTSLKLPKFKKILRLFKCLKTNI